MLWPFCNCAGAKSIRERRQFCGAREIPDLAALAGLSYADGIDSPSRVRDVEQSSPVRYLCRVRGPSTGCGGGEIAYPFACLALQVDKFTSRRLFDRLLQPHDPHHAGISMMPLIRKSSSPTSMADPARALTQSSSWIGRPTDRRVCVLPGSRSG